MIQGDSLNILCLQAVRIAVHFRDCGTYADEEILGDIQDLTHALVGRLGVYDRDHLPAFQVLGLGVPLDREELYLEVSGAVVLGRGPPWFAAGELIGESASAHSTSARLALLPICVGHIDIGVSERRATCEGTVQIAGGPFGRNLSRTPGYLPGTGKETQPPLPLHPKPLHPQSLFQPTIGGDFSTVSDQASFQSDPGTTNFRLVRRGLSPSRVATLPPATRATKVLVGVAFVERGVVGSVTGYEIQGAPVLLGYSRADVTQVYAERDQDLAVSVATKIG